MSLSKEEKKVYDRQIRLWGFDGQSRMRNTKLLVYGIRGVSCEILKNIVLAGVGYICVMDDSNVEKKDLGSQFFVREDDVGKNISKSSYKRIQELNPFVKVSFDDRNIVDKPEDFFDQFDIILLTKCCLKIQSWVNQICRAKGKKFMTADMFGLLGISFQDLGNCFTYSVKIGKKEIEKELDFIELDEVEKRAIDWSKYSKPWVTAQCVMRYMDNFKRFPGLDFVEESKKLLEKKKVDLSNFTDEYLTVAGRNSNANLTPLCAVFGGIVANEIIKAICRDADPVFNFFVYDGMETFCGIIERVE